jgi:hypothetical protein
MRRNDGGNGREMPETHGEFAPELPLSRVSQAKPKEWLTVR